MTDLSGNRPKAKTETEYWFLPAKQFIIKYNEPEFQGGKTHENNAASGSTVVTVKPETLEKLSEGEHAVKLSFDDGEVILNWPLNRDRYHLIPEITVIWSCMPEC